MLDIKFHVNNAIILITVIITQRGRRHLRRRRRRRPAGYTFRSAKNDVLSHKNYLNSYVPNSMVEIYLIILSI